MSHSTFFTGKLYARMSDDLHLGGMSEPAHVAYLRAVRKLAEYCQTPPVGRNAPKCVPRDDPTYSSNPGVQVTSESTSLGPSTKVLGYFQLPLWGA